MKNLKSYIDSNLDENLKSINTHSDVFKNMMKSINKIINVSYIDKYILKLECEQDFDIKSKEFTTLLNFTNYFIQKCNKNDNILEVIIEAEHPIEDEIKNYDIKYLYHVTNKYAYEKIKKYGLLPKDKTILVNHTNRIYFFTTYNEIGLRMFGGLSLRIFKYAYSKNKKHAFSNKINEDDIIILRINLEQLNNDNNTKLKLYGDPAFKSSNAVFTEEPIKPEYIEIIYSKN